MTIYSKYSTLILVYLVSFHSLAQENADDEEFNIAIKFSTIQTITYFNQLQMDYTDQAPTPNHLQVDFSIGNNPVLYGGEISFGSGLYQNGFYFDGVGFGFFGGNRSSLMQFYSGAGYGFNLSKKWKLIASASVGYGLYNKLLAHNYFTSVNPVVANGKTINGDFEMEIIRHSVFVKPLITLQYKINWFSVNLFGGYQLNPLDKEMIGISERSVYGAAQKTARISTGSSIKENGQYITGKMINLNGLVIGAGIVFNLYN